MGQRPSMATRKLTKKVQCSFLVVASRLVLQVLDFFPFQSFFFYSIVCGTVETGTEESIFTEIC